MTRRLPLGRLIIGCLAVVILLKATENTDVEPDALQALVAAGWLIGILALGVMGGWRALPVFAGTYIAVTVPWQLWLWQPEPEGTCDPCFNPASGVVLIMPVGLFLIAVGVGIRWRVLRRRRQVGPSA